ncbi:hypothetical protein F9946_23650 [Burkholderia thailandensis]|nr:hypothetical protein [Burkholderia thailandensis]
MKAVRRGRQARRYAGCEARSTKHEARSTKHEAAMCDRSYDARQARARPSTCDTGSPIPTRGARNEKRRRRAGVFASTANGAPTRRLRRVTSSAPSRSR